MLINRVLISCACVLLTVFSLCTYVLGEDDFYELIGVDRGATSTDIKRAFRKLAKQYHPDRNKKKDAEETFRKIAHAYEILSDPHKRAKYDRFGASAFENGGEGNGAHSFDMNEFFHNFDKFTYGAEGNGHFHHSSFNFGDLFNDDSDSVPYQTQQEHEQGGSHFASFDSFFGGGDDIFGDGGGVFQETGFGQNCRTVTKREGNTIVTHTECH